MPVCQSCGAAEAIRVRRILGEDDGRKALIAWCDTCDAAVNDPEAIRPTIADLVWLAETDDGAVQ